MSQAISKTRKFSLDHIKAQEYFLLAGPFVALIGNAASDIWLALVAIMFMVHSFVTRNWRWVLEPWFLISIVFWLWIMVVSLLSQWPSNALEQAGPWIRFPVFASAMIYWLTRSEKLWQQMLYSAMSGVLLLAAILLVERAANPDAIRLYGTWSQSTKPGWYMLGIGLPVILWALSQLKNSSANAKWSIPLVLFIFCATIATGEIYISISMIFASTLFILLSRSLTWTIVALAGLAVAGGFAILLTNPDLFYRFTGEVLVRLPWLPTSDYYDAWIGGLNTGLLRPFLGIGVDNYEFFCKELKANWTVGILGVKNCMVHPHNLYIQTFAETGVPGLALFTILAAALLRKVCAKVSLFSLSANSAIAISIIVLVVWPVSTYSQAFGQHKNMFTWFLIGWAISTAVLSLRKQQKT